MAEQSKFEQQLLERLMRDCYEFQRDNTDYMRFDIGPGQRLRTRLREYYFLLAKRTGFSRRHFSVEDASRRLAFIFENGGRIRALIDRLGDSYSKQLLLKLLEFRILGAQHVRLPLNTEQYWHDYRTIDKRFLRERKSRKTVWRELNLYEVGAGPDAYRLHCVQLGILNTFLLEQYAYRRDGNRVQAEPGDVVIDGGACWGDTALYFADKVGPDGVVYSYEFDPDNLSVLNDNLGLNPRLRERVRVVEKALWDKSGEGLDYSAYGPGTSLVVRPEQQTRRVYTLAIDDLVGGEKLGRVDFIKMDIEGAELKALRGAEATLRAFRPKLAISLYHKEDDFLAIPEYLDGLGLGYEFFLDHFTIHGEETVLFARPGGGA